MVGERLVCTARTRFALVARVHQLARAARRRCRKPPVIVRSTSAMHNGAQADDEGEGEKTAPHELPRRRRRWGAGERAPRSKRVQSAKGRASSLGQGGRCRVDVMRIIRISVGTPRLHIGCQISSIDAEIAHSSQTCGASAEPPLNCCLRRQTAPASGARDGLRTRDVQVSF